MAEERDTVVDGRYRIEARIGAGAMGVVFRAFDLVTREHVALKMIGGRCSDDTVAIAGLHIEADALARVRHENIVALRALGGYGGDTYLALEYVDGPNLQAVMRRATQRGETIPQRDAIGIACALARALDAVHAAGLVHRDVKPSNVIVEPSTGRPVLVDFGLAQRADYVALDSGKVVGTPLYMAPEQASGGVATARSDLYALACMTFELFAGRGVFEDVRAHSILLAHMNCTPPAISTIAPDLAPFDAVLGRALAKAPAARHESCRAFARDLVRAWMTARRAGRAGPISGTACVSRPSQLPTMAA